MIFLLVVTLIVIAGTLINIYKDCKELKNEFERINEVFKNED